MLSIRLPGYAELHCRSNFSFLTGASDPAELIQRAQELRYSALAITDECSFAGAVRAHLAAKELGFRVIVGTEMRLTLPPPPVRPGNKTAAGGEHGARRGRPRKTGSPAARNGPGTVDSGLASLAEAMAHAAVDTARSAAFEAADATAVKAADDAAARAANSAACARPHARLVLLAQTRRGYGNLSHWITVARRRALKGHYIAHPGDVEGNAPDAPMLAGLPGCLALLVPDVSQPYETVLAHARWLKTWFQDRAALALELLMRPGDDALIRLVRRVAGVTGLPIVASGDVLMHVRSRKPLQDVLTATRLKTAVALCGHALASNAEQHLRQRSRLARLYQAEWMEYSEILAKSCTFQLSELRYEYPDELVPEGETPLSHLRKLAFAGFLDRFQKSRVSKAERRRQRWQIRRELRLIGRLRYEPYFLTVADIVRWARDQKILCQGRGSAANSVVCYCLGVTEVNPNEAKLLFERFISAERAEPPDIDIDFEHQRREEVIQYIYGKYGRHRAALTAVAITYRPRSALRDVGRALGIDLQRIDAVSKSQHWFDGRKISAERLRENGFDPEAPVTRLWVELTQQLIGFPRHLSQHPGGFVIARDRIEQLVPVENASMDNRVVVQWDKDDLDALGLIKVDILALGMLSALRRSLDLIGAKTNQPAMRMQEIPAGDTATYDMICKADTIGVFQIESRAQMSMLPRLKPREYYDLVVEVAIVRPGPIEGGMVHPYLKNRTLPDDQLDYPEPLRPALERTRGIPIFQEQVMQIAMIAADFTAGEADQLRRAMAAWKRKGGLEPFRERLVGRMVDNGYDPEFAERIFKQIKGFGEYGFPESHAAGFAQLAYFSSWIKRHHPDAFLAALLNSQPMGFYAPAQLVRDARAHHVVVRPVDVACSAWECTLEEDEDPAAPLRAVRLGLNRVGSLSEEAAKRIQQARETSAFLSVEDLARRADLDAHALRALAEADALRGLSGHRHQAAWAVAGIDTRPTEMLRATRVDEVPAELEAPAEIEDTLADYRSLGLTLHRHPLALLRAQLAPFKVQTAAVLSAYPSGRLARASGLVTHRQRPETANGTVFVTLEDETGAVNVIVWPRVVESQRRPLLAARLLTVYGQWQREGDVMHLVASRLVDHTPLLQGLSARSRDFR
jgi:error-prone DNA polymerase